MNESAGREELVLFAVGEVLILAGLESFRHFEE